MMPEGIEYVGEMRQGETCGSHFPGKMAHGKRLLMVISHAKSILATDKVSQCSIFPLQTNGDPILSSRKGDICETIAPSCFMIFSFFSCVRHRREIVQLFSSWTG